MTYLKLLFVFVALGQTLLAQEKTNQFDAKGARHGVWIKYYELNHQLRYTGQFNHGKEIGIFKYYDINNDKIPIVIRKFNNTNDIAEVSFYSLNGTLESTGKMQGKNRIDKWLFYHKDGKTVMSEEFYKNGKKDGEAKLYYSNGKLTEVAHYLDGKLNGNYKRYSIFNFLYQDLTYKNDELEGLAIYYEPKNGQILSKGSYKENKRAGVWEHYENGVLVSTDEPALKPEKNKN